MGAICSQCGMEIPTFGSICPYCQSTRGDAEAQVYGTACASGLLAVGAIAWLIFHELDKALIGAAVGAVLGIVCVRRAPGLIVLAALFVVLGIPTLMVFFPDTFFRGRNAHPAKDVVGQPQPHNAQLPNQPPIHPQPPQQLPVQEPFSQEHEKPHVKQGMTFEQTAEEVAIIKELDTKLKGKTMQEVESALGVANVRRAYFTDTTPIMDLGYEWVYYRTTSQGLEPKYRVLFSMPKNEKEQSVLNKESVVIKVMWRR